MKDIKAQLDRLTAYAAECDLIAHLATDPAKRETFQRMARQHREMIEKIESRYFQSRDQNGAAC